MAVLDLVVWAGHPILVLGHLFAVHLEATVSTEFALISTWHLAHFIRMDVPSYFAGGFPSVWNSAKMSDR